MKNVKRIIAMVLALMMVCSLAATAFATEVDGADDETGLRTVPVNFSTTNGEEITNGKITISGIHTDSSGNADTEYAIYKMLHLESYHAATAGTEDAYSYVIVEEWEDFFSNNAVAKKYLTVNASGYVSWTGSQTADALNEFAEAALTYAEENGIQPVMDTKTAYTADPEYGYKMDGTTGTFYGLTLGYYLLDSNVGILCGLTTTNPNATINAKNGSPTMDKQVQEDSLADSGTASWGESNTADIGQDVFYDVTITAHAGAENYIFHDTMSAGLTFVPESLEVWYDDPDDTLEKAKLTIGQEYDLVTETEDGCTFEIVFDQDFLDTLHTNDQIFLTYKAVLNENAVIGTEPNTNKAVLEYGEGHKTTEDITTTYTYGFDLVKTNSASKLINGAEFKMYPSADCVEGTEYKFVYDEAKQVYRLPVGDEVATTDTIVVEGGKVSIHGLDNGRYYLLETVAPAGYNKLEDPIEVSIMDRYRDAIVLDGYLTGGTNPVQVINNTGAMLPSTGGFGTVMFITFGMLVVMGTGVLLVTKKRMSMIQD